MLLAGCALTATPLDHILSDSDDERFLAAVAAFRQQPTDPAIALRASRLLFSTAEELVQGALLRAARASSASSVTAVLAAERDMPAVVRDRVLSLSTTGAEAAQAAIDAMDGVAGAGDTVRSAAWIDAQVHLGLHLSFVAWANGPLASLMSGYAKQIFAATDAAMEQDPLFDNGAPLRLKGRFLARAPWPVGDRQQARELLRRAVEHAPMPIHHLFYGDLLEELGDRAGAIAQWQRVVLARPDATTKAVVAIYREMARLRLQAAGGKP